MDERICAVQRMQDYIEEHLGEEITLAELSRASRYSPFYSHRLFAELLGCGPAEYIRRLRLSRSALRLRDENVRVAELAFSLGFGSVDGYQRAFYREFGCNPHEYAKAPVPIYLFTPFGVKYREYEKESKMENVQSVFLSVNERPARKVIIKRGVKAADYWEYCEEVGCDVWGLLKSMKSLCGEPVCLWLPVKYREKGTSEYVQGVEVDADYSGVVPEGFDVISLPAAKYLRFQGEPFAEEDFAEAIDAIWKAEKKFDPANLGYRWSENSPRIQLEPVGARGYIELLPIEDK